MEKQGNEKEQEGWCFIGGESGSERDGMEWEFVGGEEEGEGQKEEEEEEIERDGSEGFSSESDNLDIDFFFMREQIECIAMNYFSKKKDRLSSKNLQKKLNEAIDIEVLVKNFVLPILPAKSLTRFRSVSKEWDRWIMNPFLAHQQSYYFQRISGFFSQKQMMSPKFLTLDNHAYGVPNPSLNFLPEFVTILSSCNGLLLCKGNLEKDTYYVCNPATKMWAQIPDPQYYHGPYSTTVLDFEPSVMNMDANYYLISALPQLNQSTIFFEVYSSKGRCWRLSETICTELEDSLITGYDDKFVLNGVAYWVTSKRKILAFDRKSWIHGIISLPKDCPSGGILANMNKEVCYIGMAIDPIQNQSFIEIYGGALDFMLKTRISFGFDSALYGSRLLHCADDNVLILINRGIIWSYDLAGERIELLRRVKEEPEETSYLPYVNSMAAVL